MDPPAYATLPDGGRLGYAVRGDGAPVLLLRPMGGSMLSWGAFGDALAARARVIAFDPRGVGASSPAPLGTTTRSMARDAQALLAHLGVARADVYGLSLGGMVATWLAVDAPDRVRRLVLASTPPRGTELRPRAVLRGLAIARCLARSAADAEACFSTRILSSQFRAARPAAVREIQRLARLRPASRRGLLALLAAAATHDARARLGAITAATLVLFGEYDPLITAASQRELTDGVPRARFALLPGVGHDVSSEAPAETAARVLAFHAEG